MWSIFNPALIPLTGMAKNLPPSALFRCPFYGRFRPSDSHGRRVSFSARWVHHNAKRSREESQSRPASRDSSKASIPRGGGQFPGVALQLDQVVEGVRAT